MRPAIRALALAAALALSGVQPAAALSDGAAALVETNQLQPDPTAPPPGGSQRVALGVAAGVAVGLLILLFALGTASSD